MASTSKCAILGGTTTLVEYVVVDVAHKGESVVEAFNEAKAGLEASSSVAVSVVLALQVNGWNQDAKAGLEELVKEQVLSPVYCVDYLNPLLYLHVSQEVSREECQIH